MQKSILLLLVFLLVANCSLRKRAQETPVPSEQVQSKKFFFKDGDVNKSKRFLLGVAPIQTDADGEEWETFLAQDDMHINIEFQATEKNLIGLQVNPSFPNDRSKWSKVLEIPILKHFYSEYRKDEYGRDTREIIENDQRSHWSRRTHMRLDFSGIKFFVDRFGSSYFSKSSTTTSVDNEEWDLKNGFLGFNINERITFSYGVFVRNTQVVNVTRRFNILAFNSDKKFKATPYHADNSKYFNILHTVSRQIEEGGSVDRQIMKAAKWDFSKPLDIYLDGVPSQYTSLFTDTIEAWGKVLQDIGAIPKGQKAFNVRTDYPSKYPFDLRYPAIHWIDSKRTSLHSPLGIALNNADVETGKMLSANVIMYGGMLEQIVNRYFNPSSVNSTALQMNSKTLLPAYSFSSPGLPDMQMGMRGLNNPQLAAIFRNIPNLNLDALDGRPQFRSFEGATQNFLRDNPTLNLLELDLLDHSKEASLTAFFAQSHIENIKANKSLHGATNVADHHDRTFAHVAAQWFGGLDFAKNVRGKEVSQHSALRSLIRNVLLHELGHFLGLGHQFKGTVVPEYGTVPKQFTNHPDNLKNPKSLYARAMPSQEVRDCEKRKAQLEELKEAQPNNRAIQDKQEECNSDFIATNSTSIMDYGNGRAEVLLPEEEVVPGAHDVLVLRYIYNGEIATYNKAKDAFSFYKHSDKEVNEEYTGYIPEKINGNKISYFPACNDYDASFLKDPMCNRWDAGTRPIDVAKSYIKDIDDNISNILFNYTDANESSARQAENRLWYLSFNTFSHLRTFYEALRIRLARLPYTEGAIDGLSMWDVLKNNEDALFEFSSACTMDPKKITNNILKNIMRDKQIRELCLANIEALAAVKKYVSLPPIDHTVLRDERDIQGGYIAGEGVREWSKYIDGGWMVLSNRPLKTVALLNTVVATPFMVYAGGITNNFFYDYEENRFLYRTLFPAEVTEITSTTVNKNLMFANERQSTIGSESKTLIGSSILSLAYFNWMMNSGPYAGNEASRLTGNYSDILKSQTAFDFNYGAIIITAVQPTEGTVEPDHVKQFTVELYDFSNDKRVKIEDFYILPEGKIIARGNNMFLFPITKMRFFSEKEAYVLVYKIGYDELRETDPLIDRSVKTHLTDKHKTIVNNCIIGDNNSGLASYFNGSAESNFKGFKITPGIQKDDNKTPRFEFEKSVRNEFNKYEEFARKKNPNLKIPMAIQCEEAVKGIGMISSVAAMLNGYWLGITNNYVER